MSQYSDIAFFIRLSIAPLSVTAFIHYRTVKLYISGFGQFHPAHFHTDQWRSEGNEQKLMKKKLFQGSMKWRRRNHREQSTILSQLTSTQRMREWFTALVDETRTTSRLLKPLPSIIRAGVWRFSLSLHSAAYY